MSGSSSSCQSILHNTKFTKFRGKLTRHQSYKTEGKERPASFLKWHPLTIEIYLSFLAYPVFKDLLNAVYLYRVYFGNLTKKKKRKLLKLQSSDEALASFIKQSTQQRGKGGERERPKVSHKGTKQQIMFQSPHCHKKHVEKERKTWKKKKPKGTFISHNAIKERIMFQSPHSSQETYQTGKGKGNLKEQ